ncbi:MAG: DNA repair protein RecO [Myxococcota bacterium]
MTRGPPSTFDDAFVLSLVPFGDVDVVARLFTRRDGRIGAFARAAKTSKRRFPSGLSSLAYGVVTTRVRASGELRALEGFDPEPGYFGLGSDPLRYGRAAYLAELVERLLPEGVAEPELFATLRQALALLAEGAGDARLLRAFELKLLAATGYLPDLNSFCGDGSSDEDALCYIDRNTGELLTTAGPSRISFPARARRAALDLYENSLTEPPQVATDVLREVSRLFAAHLRAIGVQNLRSVEFLRSLPSG